MEVTIEFLKSIALEAFDKIHPLIGTSEGAKLLQKGAGGDISMEIDVLAERIIIENLIKHKIDILLISEEIGEKDFGDIDLIKKKQCKLIIDPVDGSNNAARGIPYCSMSIAYAEGERIKDIKMAVILDLISKDLYWAVRGKGAYMNNQSISGIKNDNIKNLIFEIDIPTKDLFKYVDKLKRIIKKPSLVRILGSTALTLCQMSKGSIDVFLDFNQNNRIVDIAAGFLILKESGVKYFSIDGSDLDNALLSINTKFPFIACRADLESFIKKELDF